LTRVLLLLLLLLKSAVKRMWQQALDHLYLHVFKHKEKHNSGASLSVAQACKQCRYVPAC
jgi:hypothetical protein